MALDEQVRAVLGQLAALGVRSLSSLGLEGARQTVAQMNAGRPLEPVAMVEEILIPGPADPRPVRIYRPDRAATAGAGEAPPAVVYLHGGGWALGGLDSADALCRMLANRTGAVFFNVDYRLSPETPFPGAVDDSITSLRWMAEHAGELGVDGSRLAVAGDSAGANLATVAALALRDGLEYPLRAQLLVYPVVDARMVSSSIAENAEGYLLTRGDIEWFLDLYEVEDRLDWRVSPLLSDDLSGLPPTLILTAEFDPLRDEGEEYAAALAQAGIPTKVTRYDGLIHGFIGMSHVVERAGEAVDEAARFLTDALGPGKSPTTLTKARVPPHLPPRQHEQLDAKESQ